MKNNSKEVVLEFDLPGFKRDGIDVKISKNSIKAIKEGKKEVQKKNFFHSEKSQSQFQYATTIPEINPKKAKTEFKNGKLKLLLLRIKFKKIKIYNIKWN